MSFIDTSQAAPLREWDSQNSSAAAIKRILQSEFHRYLNTHRREGKGCQGAEEQYSYTVCVAEGKYPEWNKEAEIKSKTTPRKTRRPEPKKPIQTQQETATQTGKPKKTIQTTRNPYTHTHTHTHTCKLTAAGGDTPCAGG